MTPTDRRIRAAAERARLDQRSDDRHRLSLDRGPQRASTGDRRSVRSAQGRIIVAGGNAVAAAKQATTSIPIVFPVAVDPLGSGFVASLSRPGGNVTGLSLQGTDVAGKRLQMLREIVPGLRRLAIMVNIAYPAAKNELAECQAAARALGLEATLMELRRPEDIATTFDSLGGGAEALYVVSDALTNTNYARIAALALSARLPTMFGTTDSIN